MRNKSLPDLQVRIDYIYYGDILLNNKNRL